MNARVFLLLVVTGLFMAVWNGDQTAEQQFLAQRARQRAAMMVAEQETEPSAVTAASAARLTGMPPECPKTADAVPGEIRPTGITAGQYRVVSENGQHGEITVADDGNQGPDRGLYTVDTPDGIRWYFIRITSGS